MSAFPVLPPDLRSALSSLFLTSSATDCSPAYLLLSAALLPPSPHAAALARELSLRDTRPRLFLHVLSASGAKSCPPEAVLAVLRCARAAVSRSPTALAQLASDVGVRPLVAVGQTMIGGETVIADLLAGT